MSNEANAKAATILPIINLLEGSKYSVKLGVFQGNTCSIELLHTLSGLSSTSMMPLDHHLEVSRIENCVQFMKDKLSKTIAEKRLRGVLFKDEPVQYAEKGINQYSQQPAIRMRAKYKVGRYVGDHTESNVYVIWEGNKKKESVPRSFIKQIDNE